MNYYLVAPTIRVHTDGYFTYQSTEELVDGTIVLIEIGKRSCPAVVIKKVTRPSFATKPVLQVLEATPLPKPILYLGNWLEKYYASPTSSVWQTILPRGLHKSRRIREDAPAQNSRLMSRFSLNAEQKNAVNTIIKSSTETSLLEGVTGSGKTAVYIEVAKQVINKEGRSVIILVPEIALTSQLVAEFSHHFKDILLTHSELGEAQRHIIWKTVLNASKPQIIIGPRSALFMPLKDIGLVVIDECHEPSFKQEQSPRYSALRAAKVLTTEHRARLVLGSATPNVSDRFLAEQSSANIISLPTPAKKIGRVDIELVDSRETNHFTRHNFFSKTLLAAIEQALTAKQQVLLFHNRRGSNPITLCENCGWSAICNRCFVPLVLHADKHRLQCHVCGLRENVPTSCPTCGRANVIHKGIGTKRVEDEIVKLFPNAKVARFDGDNLKHQTLGMLYQDVYSGNIDILVGTQIVAKGLDLPKLSTVGVIQADNGLSLPDFGAEERVFQLLYQVMGRVGRDDKLSKIIVQTYQPDNYAIKAALEKKYDKYYKYALAKRHVENFPPYTYLLKLTCSYKSETSSHQAALKLLKHLQNAAAKDTEFLGPSPAFYERVGGSYRWQIIIKSPKRSHLVALLSHVPQTKWQAELDPISLL